MRFRPHVSALNLFMQKNNNAFDLTQFLQQGHIIIIAFTATNMIVCSAIKYMFLIKGHTQVTYMGTGPKKLNKIRTGIPNNNMNNNT